MNVPFVDLKAQYESIKSEIDGAIQSVIDKTAFISGEFASSFEKEFSNYLGLENVVACANGTDSLEILLQAAGIGIGDEVIVPAISWISTSEAVSSIGAKPVFVDVDENNLIDLSKIEEKITPRTKAIIPVHLYGYPVRMDLLMEIANRNKLFVLEDCAQSHGAEVFGKMVGTFGDCSSYSFYPGKNLGAYGDAGAMATNNSDLARVSRAIANHGQIGKHNHIMEGRNSRMDGIQGAILNVKLKYLNEWTSRRIDNAALYNKYLKSNVVRPQVQNGLKHVFHLFVIKHERRDELALYLKECGIETAIHYPTPLPLLPCYCNNPDEVKHQYPKATEAANRILSLPMYAELSEKQIEYVASKVNEFGE
ncbi:MAG: hypothetical protein RL204_1794 [Bacteroidota bacterium]|jgi:dTDP-4-amino-4,6-dideoxygalactose transaminase